MSQKYISLEGLQAYTNKLKDAETTKKIFGFNIWDTPAQNIELSNSFSMNGTTLNLNAASASTLGGVKIGGSVTNKYANLGTDENNNIVLPISDRTPLKDLDSGGLSIGLDNNTLSTILGTTGEWEGLPMLTVLSAPHADKADSSNDAYIDKNTGSLDQITDDGVYKLGTEVSGPWPIQNHTWARGRMFVITSNNGGNNDVITQILMLNNNVGGEGNVYIRSCQQGTWKPWGKLQTNIEVGAIGLGQDKTFNDLIDNGIYSGANVIQIGTDSNGYPITGYETFVLITINGYQTGAGITQLKHSINTNGEMKTQSRKQTSDAWSEWEDISSNSNNGVTEIPVATSSTLGGIKVTGDALGSSVTIMALSTDVREYIPVQITQDSRAVVALAISTATESALGGIKITGNALGSSVTINSASTTAGRYYPVQITRDDKAVVNVPWTSSSSTTPVTTTTAATIATLAKNKMTLATPVSTATNLTISAFEQPTASVVNNYGLTIQNIPSSSYTITYPTNKTIKWANGIEPFFTGGETLEIIFTTINGGTTYTATWTKYF